MSSTGLLSALKSASIAATAMCVSACGSSEQAADAPPATVQNPAAKADMISLVVDIRDAARPCDESMALVVDGIKKEDTVGVYKNLEKAEPACASARSTIFNLTTPPTIVGQRGENLKKALVVCENAYELKRSLAAELKPYLLGNVQQDTSSQLRAKIEKMAEDQSLCGNALKEVQHAFGVTDADIGL